ncbi:SOS response-associated peptidase [Odoribacter laneus]|uniref:SOS response-associated peptidase n=1 Tax=Odoribacter laneus TaxID=626933 RepID=UPI003AB3D168
MCFHNSMTKKAKQLANRYQRKLNFSESATECAENLYHISAFNNPLYPVITASSEIQLYRWGLIPFWVKTEEDADSIRTKTYNARAESIFDKPSFRSSVTSKRCLIPSTGWFDWRHEKGKKIPYFIYVKDEEIFSMAGIYSEWQHPQTRQTLYTFSIITTAANELMRCIHNTNSVCLSSSIRKKKKNGFTPNSTALPSKNFCNLLIPIAWKLMLSTIIFSKNLPTTPQPSNPFPPPPNYTLGTCPNV